MRATRKPSPTPRTWSCPAGRPPTAPPRRCPHEPGDPRAGDRTRQLLGPRAGHPRIAPDAGRLPRQQRTAGAGHPARLLRGGLPVRPGRGRGRDEPLPAARRHGERRRRSQRPLRRACNGVADQRPAQAGRATPAASGQGVRGWQRAQRLPHRPDRHAQRALRAAVPGGRGHPRGGAGPRRHPGAQGLLLRPDRPHPGQAAAADARGRRNRASGACLPGHPRPRAGGRQRGAVLMDAGVDLPRAEARSPVRVLVVDDSAVMRQLMPALLGADPAIEVVGAAADAYIARDKIKRLRPDVITLDVEMPRMDGLSFLRQLMRLSPLPVVMVSTLTEQGASVTLDALASGAVDFIAKPRADSAEVMEAYAAELRAKVLAAARARVRASAPVTPSAALRSIARLAPSRSGTFELVAIGASTGGTEAIRQVLAPLPADMPPVVIAQHIPATFSAAFAERLDRHCALNVVQATDGEPLQRGCAYVAPGG